MRRIIRFPEHAELVLWRFSVSHSCKFCDQSGIIPRCRPFNFLFVIRGSRTSADKILSWMTQNSCEKDVCWYPVSRCTDALCLLTSHKELKLADRANSRTCGVCYSCSYHNCSASISDLGHSIYALPFIFIFTKSCRRKTKDLQ